MNATGLDINIYKQYLKNHNITYKGYSNQYFRLKQHQRKTKKMCIRTSVEKYAESHKKRIHTKNCFNNAKASSLLSTSLDHLSFQIDLYNKV